MILGEKYRKLMEAKADFVPRNTGKSAREE
jgi:hypothetical protein